MLFQQGWREGKSIPQLLFQPLDDIPHAHILFHTGGDQLVRMDDGAVIPAAERLADILQGAFRQAAAQVHGDLARKGDAVGAALAGQVADLEFVKIRHALLDGIYGQDAACFFPQDVA